MEKPMERVCLCGRCALSFERSGNLPAAGGVSDRSPVPGRMGGDPVLGRTAFCMDSDGSCVQRMFAFLAIMAQIQKEEKQIVSDHTGPG